MMPVRIESAGRSKLLDGGTAIRGWVLQDGDGETVGSYLWVATLTCRSSSYAERPLWGKGDCLASVPHSDFTNHPAKAG